MRYLSLLFVFFIGFFLNAQFVNRQKNKIDVLSYKFHIDINDKNNEIVGKAIIKIKFLKNTSNFYIDFDDVNKNGSGMYVSAVKNDDKVVTYSFNNDKIFFDGNWQKNDTIIFSIYYHGIPKDGLYISKNKYGSRSFFGDNWPNRAHYWLPVLDHPSDKALVEFYISAPNHYEVVASGSFIDRTKQKDKIVWHYKSKVPFATKVMVFGAADFNIKNYAIYHNIPIESWIYKNSPLKGLDDYAASVEIIKYYDSLIGSYSYSKLVNVQSKTRFGGMENAGNIFYNENSINGKANVDNLLAHEIAHQWFGNSVTEKNWSDIWLSEGFATYLTDLFIEHKQGEKAYKNRMIMERDKVIRYNLYNSKPVVYTEKNNLFNLLNRNSYEKGAWILHMLRQKIGDKKFFKILKTFFKKYKNKNASTSDFIKICNKISNQDLTTFFNQWLYKKGIPKLTISSSVEKNIIIINIKQYGENYKIDLPVRIKYGNKIIIDKTLHIYKQENIYKIKLSKNIKENDYKIIVDPNVKILFVINE